MGKGLKMGKYKVVGVTEEDYMEMTESYMGFCPDCGDFTRDTTEPDAENYDCPDCEKNNVVGAEQALLLGLIDITESEE
jgi:predicted RNA-binding Zn-ribbon protein involved in translation (DUF1610 family)